MKIKEIVNTGIKNKHSNGARDQEIILQVDTTKEKFKIFIHSESYEFQSYARLYKWNTVNGWNVINSVNPKTDYYIDLSYRTAYPQSSFDPIIRDFKKLIKVFIDEDNPNISSGSN
jgi:hypothetical protein